ncbi:MAG: DMT family transporter, partial [Candidatus Heimdallarchaeaceae archaeon]
TETMEPIEKTRIRKTIKNFFTNPVWLLGLLFTTFSVPAAIFAYSYGNILLIASINGSGLVFLSIFSYLILKEKMNVKEIVSFLLIIVGVVVSSFFSSQTYTQSSIDEFWNLYVYQPFFIATILLVFEIVVKFSSVYSGVPNTLTAGILMSLAIINMKGWSIYFSIPISIDVTDFKFWLLGGLNMLLANIATILMQISYQKAKAIVIVPIYHSSVLIFPTIYAVLFLREWETMSFANKMGLSFSLMLIVLGILLLIVSKEKSQKKI